MSLIQSRLRWILLGGLVFSLGVWLLLDGPWRPVESSPEPLADLAAIRERLSSKSGEVPSLFPPVLSAEPKSLESTDSSDAEIEEEREMLASLPPAPEDLPPRLQEDLRLIEEWEEGRGIPPELLEELEEGQALLGITSDVIEEMALEQAIATQRAYEEYMASAQEIPMPDATELARMRDEADNQPGLEEKAQIWKDRYN
jgi:hypothetical protein